MSLSIGIVGLPNVGKSTLFNALTNNEVLAANYPFATIDPNVGVVAVPDGRLEQLAALYDDAPIVPATVTFVDIAGIVRGASQGEGLGNKFLAAIRESDAICQVVRVFHDDDVIHVDGRVDPESDIGTVNTELILADLQTVENRLPKLAKEARARPELKATAEAVAVAAAHPRRGSHHLERGGPGRGRRRPALRAPSAHGEAVHLRLQRRRGRAGRRGVGGAVGRRRGARQLHRAVRPDRGRAGPDARPTTPRSSWRATGRRSRAWSDWSTWASPRSDCRRS